MSDIGDMFNDAVIGLKKELPYFAAHHTDKELLSIVTIVAKYIIVKPWKRLGISRSTYYNDLRRSKLNENNAKAKHIR